MPYGATNQNPWESVRIVNWREFEVFTAELFDQLVPPAVVTHDLRLEDVHGVQHQIDVDIQIPDGDGRIKIMLDTKLQKRRVSKGDVQKLAKTRDQLGYDLAGVVANRLDGFSIYAKRQTAVDDIRVFDLSHWLIVKTEDGEFGVTGGGPFSDEFVAGTRVIRCVPVAEGPLFQHPYCADGCHAPDIRWVTEAGATVGETIRQWLDQGVIQGWREEKLEDAQARLGELAEGEAVTRNFEVSWDEPLAVRDPGASVFDGQHFWRGFFFASQLEALPASAKRTEWFLRRLDEGDWRFLAYVGAENDWG